MSVIKKRGNVSHLWKKMETQLPRIWRRLRYSMDFWSKLNQQVVQPHSPTCRRQRQWLGEWRTTHCRRAGLRPSKECERAQSTGPDEMHLGILRQLADEVAKLLFEKSWLSCEVPTGWKRGNIILIFKKGKRKTWGTTVQSVSPGKIMQQIFLGIVLGHMEKK